MNAETENQRQLSCMGLNGFKTIPFDATQNPPANSRGLQAVLRGFLWMLLGLTAVSVAFELVNYFALGRGYPYASPLVAPQSRLDDLLDWLPYVRAMHTPAFFHQDRQLAYPAPMDTVYWLLAQFGSHALSAYLTLSSLIVGTALLLLARRLHREDRNWPRVTLLLGVLTVTSYPLAFLIYTGNLEIVLWAVCLAGIWAYSRDHEGWAAACFAIAAAMKLYPAAYFALFLTRRSWPRLVQGAGIAAAVTLGGLWAEDPNIREAWYQTRHGVSGFVNEDALGFIPEKIGFDHSLWALLKGILPPFGTDRTPHQLSSYLLTVACIGTALWFWRVSKLPLLERITFLSAGMITLTAVSYDYTLIHLYAAAALALLAALRGELRGSAAWWFFGLLAICLTAQGFLVIDGHHHGAQLKAVALTGLIVWACLCRPDISLNVSVVD